jgi:hypothetical protein
MRLAALGVALVLVALPAGAQAAPLAGPDGTSLNKVLVIGTDGTRWDLLGEAMKAAAHPTWRACAGRASAVPRCSITGPTPSR